MRRDLLLCIVLCSLAVTAPGFAEGQSSMLKPLPGIAEKTHGMEKFPGFLTDYWDAREGKIWLQIDKWDTEFLYVESLPNGVGSNDIGLDRGQPGETQVVHFERSGARVLLVAENQKYRAVTDDPDQREAVKEAFAQSVLWGFDVAAADGDSVLVDATLFFERDAHGVAAKLGDVKQGEYRLEASRCAIELSRTRNFPENTEVESTITFVGAHPGRWVREVTPDPQAITVREHFSLIQAPPPGFHMRAYDPRCGFFGLQYMDFATPVDQPIVKRFIERHRLQKRDPSAALSDPVKPIVYYVDSAIPEPIRSAVVEGVSWWNQAFTAAGYRHAFQVKLLPPGADPMDIRYNVIEWTPRRTRGWSYGSVVADPRTGEIINGHVTLDALRIRQDFLIAQGLLDPFGRDPGALRKANEMALARVRQLAAHETGHTLGLMHNFAASMVDRASVMDYPPPDVTLGADGAPNVSNAYAVGSGAWDKVAIQYGYQDFSSPDESYALQTILDEAFARGQLYLTDQDARSPDSASPTAHLWDVGANALGGLKQVTAVRAAALKRLSADAIPEGAPLATLEDVLVPVYLYHRYQLTAVAKLIGGETYAFNVRGGVQPAPQAVPADQQRAAIRALLDSLRPAAVALPDSILRLLPPRPPQYPPSQENFAARTSPTFDSLAPAESLAEIVTRLLVEPHRAQRMIEDHAHDANSPGFVELVDDLLAATWKTQPETGYDGALQQTVNSVVLDHLMSLAADEATPPQVRAIASLKLHELGRWTAIVFKSATDEGRRAQLFFAQQQIDRFEKDPAAVKIPVPAPPPAGDPIGADAWE